MNTIMLQRCFSLYQSLDRASQIGIPKAKPCINECLDWLNSIHSYEDEDRSQIESLNNSLRKLFVNGLKHDAFIRKGISVKNILKKGKSNYYLFKSILIQKR